MGTKIRLADIGKEFGKNASYAFEQAKAIGLNVKSTSSSITEEEASILYEYLTTGVNPNIQATQDTADLKLEGKKSKKASTESKAKKETKKAKAENSKEETSQEAPENTEQEAITEDVKQIAPIEPKKGLRIVRKNKEQEPKITESKKEESKKQTLSYKELLAESANESPKKPKRDKPKSKVAHKHTDQKMHILDDREIAFDYDDEQDEIMLFDLNETQVRDEEEENQIRQAITERVHIHRKNPWMNEGSIKRGGQKTQAYQSAKK